MPVIQPHGPVGQGVFPGARQDGDAAHRLRRIKLGVGLIGGGGPADLEGELRHPVAVSREVQVLDHHVGRAAIGRHPARPFHGFHLGIGLLAARAAINPHVQIAPRDLLPVGPDAAHMADLAFAQGDSQAHGIAVFPHHRIARGRRRRCSLAAAAVGLRHAAARYAHPLAEFRGPDHLPGHPHPPMHLRHRVALARAGQPQPLDPAGLDDLRALPHQPLVDRPPDQRARKAPDRGHGQAQHRAPDRAPDRRTCRGK